MCLIVISSVFSSLLSCGESNQSVCQPRSSRSNVAVRLFTKQPKKPIGFHRRYFFLLTVQISGGLTFLHTENHTWILFSLSNKPASVKCVILLSHPHPTSTPAQHRVVGLQQRKSLARLRLRHSLVSFYGSSLSMAGLACQSKRQRQCLVQRKGVVRGSVAQCGVPIPMWVDVTLSACRLRATLPSAAVCCQLSVSCGRLMSVVH